MIVPCAQVGQLVYVLRKRISLPAEKAIFLFVDNTCEHYCMHTTCTCAIVRACARAYLRVCTLREPRMRVAHTCASHTHARRTHVQVAALRSVAEQHLPQVRQRGQMCSAHEVLTGR